MTNKLSIDLITVNSTGDFTTDISLSSADVGSGSLYDENLVSFAKRK